MSKKNVVILVLIAVVLAVLRNILVRQPVAATPTATITSTTTATSTSTTVPTATITQTPYPTFVPTQEPTKVPEPSGTGWTLIYEFGGGPTVLANSPCYAGELTDCIGKEVVIYLEGYQANEVYLNGFNNERVDLWTIRLVPGHNRLVVPEANKIGIGNKTDISVRESNSTGYYLSCSPDSSGEGSVCTQFNDWTVIYQSPYGDFYQTTIQFQSEYSNTFFLNDQSPYGDFYQTTIQFQSEYSNTFFLNDMVKGKSIPIQSGDVLLLPKYDHETWDVSVLPFYGERPTPMPTRTPTIQP